MPKGPSNIYKWWMPLQSRKPMRGKTAAVRVSFFICMLVVKPKSKNRAKEMQNDMHITCGSPQKKRSHIAVRPCVSAARPCRRDARRRLSFLFLFLLYAGMRSLC